MTRSQQIAEEIKKAIKTDPKNRTERQQQLANDALKVLNSFKDIQNG